MRVLFVIDALGEGGTELSLAELLPSLMARDVQPSVAVLRPRTETGVEDAIRALGVPVVQLRSERLAAQVLQLRRVIISGRFELVHSMLFSSNVRARLAGRLAHRPVVNSLVNTTYARDLAEPSAQRRMKRSLVRHLDRLTGRWTTAYHAVSHAVRRDAVLGLRLDPARVVVVERSRSPERLGEPSGARRASVRQRLGIDPSAPVVVSIGRQEPAKGHLHLLAAIRIVVARIPHLQVLVAGRPGTETAAIEAALSSTGLRGSVRFLGHRDDIPDLLAAADLFVLPSRYEGMPGALIEAMALGLPAVASDIDPVVEVVEPGGNAVLVPLDQPERFASAIIEVLGDEQRRTSMGRRSREIFERRFSSDTAAERMAALYQSARLGPPDAHPPASEPPARVHGVLVTYRRPAELEATLARLSSQTRRLDSLTVVDNAGSDETQRLTARVCTDLRTEVILSAHNLGPAGGYALATRRLLPRLGTSDWLLFLDDDDPPVDDVALERLAAFATTAVAGEPMVAAVGNAGARFDARSGRLRRLPDSALVRVVPVDYVPGGHLLMVSAAALREAGSFDPGLFFGFGDLELGLRFRRFGFEVRADGERWLEARRRLGRLGPRVRQVPRPVSYGRRYYAVRNQIIVTRRYGARGAAARATTAHLVGRPLADLARGRSAVRLWRASLRGIVDAWTDVTGPTVPLDGDPR